MVSELEQYIADHLQKGYSKQQLKEHLRIHGYDEDAINKAFAQLTHQQLEQQQPDLVAYVESYLSQGYKAEQLYEKLKEQGYSPTVLEGVFRRVQTTSSSSFQNIKKRWKKPDAIAIMLSLPIIFFILIFIYLYNNPSGEFPLVDEVTQLKPTIPNATLSTNNSPSFTESPFDDPLTNAFASTTKEEALSWCGQLADQSSMTTCHLHVAETFSDPDSCEHIQNSTIQANCFVTLVIAGDTSLCSRLSEEQRYILCPSS